MMELTSPLAFAGGSCILLNAILYLLITTRSLRTIFAVLPYHPLPVRTSKSLTKSSTIKRNPSISNSIYSSRSLDGLALDEKWLLVTAHPDDECMFFALTLHHLTCVRSQRGRPSHRRGIRKGKQDDTKVVSKARHDDKGSQVVRRKGASDSDRHYSSSSEHDDAFISNVYVLCLSTGTLHLHKSTASLDKCVK